MCGRRASLRSADVFLVFASEIRLLFAGYRRARRLQNVTLFKTKKCSFRYPVKEKRSAANACNSTPASQRVTDALNPLGYFFRKLSKLSTVLFSANLFFLLVVHVHLKLENNEDAHL